MKRARKTIFLAMLLVVVFMLFPGITSRADDGTGIDDGGAFDDIEGLQSYECYYFDLEELGILDAFSAAINAVGNLVWNIIKLLTKLVMMIMYVSLDFDAGELLSPYLSGIQSTIHDSLFEPLFVLAFCGMAVILLKRMFVRDLMGAFGDIVKVVVIVVLSVALVEKSDSALSMITGVTKEASVEILMGINDNTGISGEDSEDESAAETDFALSAAAMLWTNLVEEPWLYLEFAGTDPTEEDIKNFLNVANPPGSENRADLVANYSGAAVCFEKGRALIRLACLLVYFIPFIVKFALYTVVAGIQLIMQVITVVYMLIAPVILLLALLPGYENAISKWLRKMLEAQLGILIITFLLGIIIKVDKELYGMMDVMGGFLVVCIIQMVVMVGIYFGRNKIMGMLAATQDVGRTLNHMKNDVSSVPDKIRSVRERFMTEEQRYLRAYDENLKKSYDEQTYRENYAQNLEEKNYYDVKDYQRPLYLATMEQREKEKKQMAAALAPEDNYAASFDEGMRKNYYRKQGKEKYDREIKAMRYEDLEDYQKDYWMQLHSEESSGNETGNGQAKKAPRMQPEETENGGEDIYAGNEEMNASQGSKRVIIKKKNSELKNGLPLRSEYPNVAMDKTDDEGHVYQRRLFNENCMSDRDFDTTDHKNPEKHPTGAHKHVFQGEKRGDPQALTEEELEENRDIIQRGVNYHDEG